MFKAFTFWPGFQPGRYFTSTPINWLNCVTRLDWAGKGAWGRTWDLQNSHENLRAASSAASDACPCFRILTKSAFEGWPRFLWSLAMALRTVSSCSDCKSSRWAARQSDTCGWCTSSSTTCTRDCSRALANWGTCNNTASTNSAVYWPANLLTEPTAESWPATTSWVSCFGSPLPGHSNPKLRMWSWLTSKFVDFRMNLELLGSFKPKRHMWHLTRWLPTINFLTSG